MRAIRCSFFQMLAAMRRDLMLFAACLGPFLIGFVFRFAIPPLEAGLRDRLSRSAVLSPYYGLMDIFFSMLCPAMFCFASAMVSLEEADEKTAAYLFVTPLGKKSYLFARLGLPSLAAFLITVALLPVFRLTSLSLSDILLLAAEGALQGMILSLLILTLSSNKLEGMAVAKLSSLIIFGAVIPFFIRHRVQYGIAFLPSFWAGKAILENMPLTMLPAFGLSALWISLLFRRYLRKI